ncbi:hypothetical protein [Colwellia psychrerythraea]|uniref:Uncharacterized protein n=1 Tax=Colwellia psychrerythraea TaxID=28229 RepID=A0A099KKP3_COLPS|nr:hypothetical protein [Colwellia psychrerythraea]KGJ91001.1 hypothetical protein GAB14E_0665 [Colwellia psychrerythraea]
MNNEHTNKRILARGCDPVASQQAAQALPPLMGNPEYVATSDDVEFIDKLKNETWSVIFFAPGACRFNAENHPIPGNNKQTRGWSLEQYKALVRQTQGANIQIVETLSEQETVTHLKAALAAAQ